MMKYKFYNMEFMNYNTPKMKVVKKRGSAYISYGEDNKYPEYLDSLIQNAEHNAILQSKVDFISGEGFNIDGLTPEQVDFFVDNDMDGFATSITADYERYGGFCFKVIRSKDLSIVTNLQHVDFSKVRVNEKEDGYLIGDDWTVYRTNSVEIAPYDPNSPQPESLYYYKGSSKTTYPYPKYYGAIPAIETGIEIDNFHLNHVRNGFFIPTVFNFNNGIPEEEEQDIIERDIRGKFTGTDNAGKFLLSFNEDKDSAVTVDTFEPADLDKMFDVLAEQIQQKILVGHRVTTPSLFGVKTEGQLGGRMELVEGFELFKSIYASPVQKTICSIIEEVLDDNWSDLTVELKGLNPITERLNIIDIKDNLTDDELRASAGYDEREMSEIDAKLHRLNRLQPAIATKIIERLSDEEIMELYTGEKQ